MKMTGLGAARDPATPEVYVDTKTFADIEWSGKSGRYSVGSEARINGIKVGETGYPTQTKAYEGPRWSGTLLLPGVSLKSGLLFDTEQEAMAAVGKAVRRWFEITAKRSLDQDPA
jgi:hypothetical protein